MAIDSETTYECPECDGKAYKRYDYLKKHCMNKHGIELPDTPDDDILEKIVSADTKRKIDAEKKAKVEAAAAVKKEQQSISAEKQALIDGNIKSFALSGSELHAVFITNDLDHAHQSFEFIEKEGWERIHVAQSKLDNLYIYCKRNKK